MKATMLNALKLQIKFMLKIKLSKVTKQDFYRNFKFHFLLIVSSISSYCLPEFTKKKKPSGKQKYNRVSFIIFNAVQENFQLAYSFSKQGCFSAYFWVHVPRVVKCSNNKSNTIINIISEIKDINAVV